MISGACQARMRSPGEGARRRASLALRVTAANGQIRMVAVDPELALAQDGAGHVCKGERTA
jgi:hypothetical protein